MYSLTEAKLRKTHTYFTLIMFLHIEVHTHLQWAVMQEWEVLVVSFSVASYYCSFLNHRLQTLSYTTEWTGLRHKVSPSWKTDRYSVYSGRACVCPCSHVSVCFTVCMCRLVVAWVLLSWRCPLSSTSNIARQLVTYNNMANWSSTCVPVLTLLLLLFLSQVSLLLTIHGVPSSLCSQRNGSQSIDPFVHRVSRRAC